MPEAAPPSPPAGELPRRFGFWTGLFVVVASMVGSGILMTSGFIIRDTESHTVLLGLWVAGGVLAVCGALTLAELAAAMPRAGGEYVYVRTALGPACGFAYGASTILLGFAAPIALIAHATVEYLAAGARAADPGGSVGAFFAHPAVTPALASALIVLCSVVHMLGQRESAALQAATTLLKFVTLTGLAVAGLCVGNGTLEHFAAGRALGEQDAGTLAVALIFVAYAFSGWNGAAYLAGEIRDPQRLLPRCLVGGCLLVTLLYVALNLMYAYALGPTDLATATPGEIERIAETSALRLFGPQVTGVLGAILGLGLLASLSAFILTGPRVSFAMARDGLLPPMIGRLHATRSTPVTATLVQGALALLVLWSGEFRSLVNYSGAGMAMLSGIVVFCVFPLRRRGVLPGAFATPAFPWPPIVYIASVVLMVGYAVTSKDDALPTLLSIASILAMWPLRMLVVWVGRVCRGSSHRSRGAP